MSSNLDILRSALQVIGVVPEAQEATAEQAQHALTVMNEMLEDWAAHGIDVGQWPQTDVDAEFPGPPDSIQPVKSMLAVYLSPHYERDPRPLTVAMANAGYQRLLREAVKGQMEPAEPGSLPRSSGSWDIEAG